MLTNRSYLYQSIDCPRNLEYSSVAPELVEGSPPILTSVWVCRVHSYNADIGDYRSNCAWMYPKFQYCRIHHRSYEMYTVPRPDLWTCLSNKGCQVSVLSSSNPKYLTYSTVELVLPYVACGLEVASFSSSAQFLKTLQRLPLLHHPLLRSIKLDVCIYTFTLPSNYNGLIIPHYQKIPISLFNRYYPVDISWLPKLGVVNMLL